MPIEVRSCIPRLRGSFGKQAAVFHGQGGQSDTRKDDLTQFLRIIDKTLQPVLRDRRTPMLLAGVEYLLPIYREVNHYPHVVSEELKGNCDRLTAHQLHEKAWPAMESVIRRDREAAAARYRGLAGTDKACNDIREVTIAAEAGRIDTLFVDNRARAWGAFDSLSKASDVHEDCQSGDEDLLDLAAVQTIINRGRVYCLQSDEMPEGSSVAAILRY